MEPKKAAKHEVGFRASRNAFSETKRFKRHLRQKIFARAPECPPKMKR